MHVSPGAPNRFLTAWWFDAATGVVQQSVANPAPSAGDIFGRDVALHDDRALAGMQNNDTSGTDSGAAYLSGSGTRADARG